MPPKKSAEDSPMGLTDSELRFIKAVFDNMTQKPDADWTRVAGDLGLKDAKCAKERFRQMSVRHGWREQAGNGAPSPSPRKPKAPSAGVKKPRTPRKKMAKRSDSDDSDDVKGEDDDTKMKNEADEDEI
ncbi:hypothetical protein B0I35DRAFT_408160 [Stachybotrys elegans]|uniref:Myb-like domain-containing protein n=1 Tax=Stachybotrys elegans TaxID=80388 RepID=A0A8K0WST6_9HYPO|nr:hypothetical protein B0I35DRAFT_408160 [Stachybotrys elegans]